MMKRNLAMATLFAINSSCGGRSDLYSDDQSSPTGVETREPVETTAATTSSENSTCSTVYSHQKAVAGDIDAVAYGKLGKGQDVDVCESIMVNSLFLQFESGNGKPQTDNIIQCWTRGSIEQALSCSGINQEILEFDCGDVYSTVDLTPKNCTEVNNTQLSAVVSPALKELLPDDPHYVMLGRGADGSWQEREVYCAMIHVYPYQANGTGVVFTIPEEDFTARVKEARWRCEEDPQDPAKIWDQLAE